MSKIISILLLLLASEHRLQVSSCDTNSSSEILRVTGEGLAEISTILDTSDESLDLDNAPVIFEVCEDQSLTTRCSFMWSGRYKNMTVEHWMLGSKTSCFAELLNNDTTVPTVKIEISQLVRRSQSMMKLSAMNINGKFKTLRLIRLEYPAKVTSLTVDGKEVNGSYEIKEAQRVTLTCSFDKGSRPAPFRMVDKHGQELRGAVNDESISESLSVRCEDDWPIVTCEGAGSEQNRSVVFLVMCPPVFLDKVANIVRSHTIDTATVRLKAHTQSIRECVLKEKNAVKNATCSLSGKLPNLVLTLRLDKEDDITHGNRTLILRNEWGIASTTLLYTSKYTKLFS